MSDAPDDHRQLPIPDWLGLACPRCGYLLSSRSPNGMSRSLAFALAAAVINHHHSFALARIQGWSKGSAETPADYLAALFELVDQE